MIDLLPRGVAFSTIQRWLTNGCAGATPRRQLIRRARVGSFMYSPHERFGT